MILHLIPYKLYVFHLRRGTFNQISHSDTHSINRDEISDKEKSYFKLYIREDVTMYVSEHTKVSLISLLPFIAASFGGFLTFGELFIPNYNYYIMI